MLVIQPIHIAGDGETGFISGDRLGSSFRQHPSDRLYGKAANDTLDGGTGDDTLVGDEGNDTYILDSTDDLIIELAGEGTDTVNAPFDYTLEGTNLENLTLIGSAINGTGNEFNNRLTGNAGNNTLNGGAGNDNLNGGAGDDQMSGGAGNDTYIVDSLGDTVSEAENQGTDAVSALVSYTLSPNVENLTLTGSGNLNGTGNALNNKLTGNAGNNTLIGEDGNDKLNGGAGDDQMFGGAGNDTYVVDGLGDIVSEIGSSGSDLGGVDTVQSGVDWTLGNFLENLTLIGNAINGTGNALNNKLTGNAGANNLNGDAGNDTLLGAAGDDFLLGGAGNDNLTGGDGADQFLFGNDAGFTTSDLGVDRLTDFLPGSDQIVLNPITFAALTSGDVLPASEFATISVKLAQEVSEAGSSSAKIVYNTSTGNLFYNPDANTAGLDGGGLFATLTNKPSLGNTDLLVQSSI